MFGRVINMTSCLVIDDCNDDRDRTVGLLQDLGLDVKFASTEDEALQICQSEKPSMILVADAGDKRKTSSMLIRLKAIASQLKDQPIILMCARDHDPDTIGSAMVHGADDCIMKPFDDAILENKLRQFGIA